MNDMRKNALMITCYVCVAAAFGAFFRWIENQAGFEQETGLVIPGSIWHFVAALVCLAGAVGLLALVVGLRRKHFREPETCEEAFHGIAPLSTYCVYLLTGMMIGSGLILYVQAGAERYPLLLRLLAIFAILSGMGLPYLLKEREKARDENLMCLCAALPVLMCSFWLVVSYKIHGTEPSAWSFGMEILAICADAVGFYYLAGYAFGRVRTYRTLYFLLLGTFLSLVAFGDGTVFGRKLLLLACAGTQLYCAWCVVSNLRVCAEKPETEAET